MPPNRQIFYIASEEVHNEEYEKARREAEAKRNMKT